MGFFGGLLGEVFKAATGGSRSGSSGPSMFDPVSRHPASRMQDLFSTGVGRELGRRIGETLNNLEQDRDYTGEHIKVARKGGSYYHHAIGDGAGGVFHYDGEWTGKSQASIHWSPLDEFSQGGLIILVQHSNRKYSRDETLYRASQRYGEKEYNLLFNNCEHFATWCIMGEADCGQLRGER